MINESELIAGTRVEWTSQAGGYVVKKQGTVVAFVPRKQPKPADLLVSPYRVHGGNKSHLDRYLILLESKNIRGVLDAPRRAHKNHYYLPVASVVRKGTLIASPAQPSSGSAIAGASEAVLDEVLSAASATT